MSDQPQPDPQQQQQSDPSQPTQDPSSSLATTTTTGLQPTSQPTTTATPTPLAAPALAAPFVNTLSKVLPYFGTSVQSQPVTSSATAGVNRIEGVTYSGPISIPSTISGGVATPLPGGAGLARPIIAGYIRIKAFGAGTVTNIIVTGSDGTNTETYFSDTTSVALTATAGMTRLIPFESEISPIIFTVTLTGGTGATVSIEISGASGNP